MSRIDELIEKLCPDGVEYKALKNVARIVGGRDYKEFGPGDIPVYGSGGIMTYVDKSVAEGPTVLLPRKGSIGNIFYVEGPFWNVDTVFYTEIDVAQVHPRFFYHVMLNEHIEKLNTSNAARPALTRTVLNKIRIPVPPMEVQEEIVRVLDSFAELEAELEVRRRQYAYYRDILLTFEERVSRVTLGEICLAVCSGGTPNKKHPEFYENGSIPWLRTQQVAFNEIHEVDSYITEAGLKGSSAKWIPANCVIVAISGATAGRCAINKIPLTTNQHCLNMEIDASVADYRYVYHCICKQNEELLSLKEGARGDLNASRIKGLTIPLPSLEEQRRIVAILDQFDALVNDFSQGVPAEIEARRK